MPKAVDALNTLEMHLIGLSTHVDVPDETTEIAKAIEEVYAAFATPDEQIADPTVKKRYKRVIYVCLRTHPATYTHELVRVLHMLDDQRGIAVQKVAQEFPEPAKQAAIDFLIKNGFPTEPEPADTLIINELEAIKPFDMTGITDIPLPAQIGIFEEIINEIARTDTFTDCVNLMRVFIATHNSKEALTSLLHIFNMHGLPSFIYLGVCKVMLAEMKSEEQVETMIYSLNCLPNLYEEQEVTYLITSLLIASFNIYTEGEETPLLNKLAAALMMKVIRPMSGNDNYVTARGILSSLLSLEPQFSEPLKAVFKTIKQVLKRRTLYKDLFKTYNDES